MKNKLLCFILIVFAFASCRKAPLSEDSLGEQKSTLKLGRKLENPYSVKNMRQAYRNITAGSAKVSDDPITATHYYVRFLPSDTAQYNRLKNDTTLKIYPYPLDYELPESDDYFAGDGDDPVWQYTAVKIDYQFDPNIYTEVLEELYIPEEDPEGNTSGLGSSSKAGFNTRLVNEAMRITNNLKDIRKDTGTKTSWVPQGTIRVWDTRLNQLIPLVGVRVRARRWFTIKEVFTDVNGHYQMSSYSNPANYAIFFETDEFDIRSGTFGQAWRNGPKQDTPWDVDIYDGVQRFYSHVFRGARRFFYGNTGGLRVPNTNFFHGKIKYSARDGAGEPGINWTVTGTQGGILPDIRVHRYNNSWNEYASDEIFSTTVHETAHTTHMNAMNGFGVVQFWQVSPTITESWAVGVEWQVTQMEYRERGISNYSSPTYNVSALYPTPQAYQYWTPGLRQDYTSLFIDIIDDYNQNPSNPTVMDRVSGYTLAQIETYMLHNIYGISSLSTQLKGAKPSGITDVDIDDLLNGTPIAANTFYRYRRFNSGYHFYTTNYSELGSGSGGWALEGPQCKIFTTSQPGTVPFYRYREPNGWNHIYQTSNGPIGGYILEGVCGYVYATAVSGSIPLYRFYKSNSGHFFTTSYSEGANNGFTYEGVACHVMPN